MIEVKEYYPRRWWLKVNGVKVGEYIYGEDKKYLNPEKWAKEQVPKRLKVVQRNIDRLQKELGQWLDERDKLKEF